MQKPDSGAVAASSGITGPTTVESVGGHKRGTSSVMPETVAMAKQAEEIVTSTISAGAVAVGGNVEALRSAASQSADKPADPEAYKRGAARGATIAGFINCK